MYQSVLSLLHCTVYHNIVKVTGHQLKHLFTPDLDHYS